MPYTYEYPRPALTVDACLFTYFDDCIHLLLIERKHAPYEGKWALPGGFVDADETAEDAIQREMFEETGLKDLQLYQLFTNSNLNRDPRGRTVSVVYFGFIRNTDGNAKAGDDAAQAKWFPLNQLPPLAFDHEMHVDVCLTKLKRPAATIGDLFSIMPRTLKIEQLIAIYRQLSMDDLSGYADWHFQLITHNLIELKGKGQIKCLPRKKHLSITDIYLG